MVTVDKFGVPIDGQRAGMLMPKQSHHFRVTFQNFGPLGSNDVVTLSRQVQTATKPSIQQPEVEVHSYNSTAYFGGKHAWQAIELAVRDDITNAVTRLVYHQLQKQLNHFEQTTTNAAGNYKFDMRIEMLDGGNNATLENWELEGCWLSNVSSEGLTYESANIQMINMTVRYDNATIGNGLMTETPQLFQGRTGVSG